MDFRYARYWLVDASRTHFPLLTNILSDKPTDAKDDGADPADE